MSVAVESHTGAPAFTSEKKENIAAVLYTANDLRVENVSFPEPGPGDVQISMRSVGICGSDVHFWKHGAIGHYQVKAPMILGHEGSGVVTKVGPNVTGFSVGDRVAIEPGIPCSKCRVCRNGRYNLCDYVKFAATPPVHGSLANYITHPAEFCYKLPAHVTFEEAAMFEPLSVAIHACRRGDIKVGQRVLITGAGPIGLMCLLVAKSAGAASVTITDLDERRLKVAREKGADNIVLVGKGSVETIEADVCIEASGSEAAISMCIESAARGGVVVLVGMGKAIVQFPVLSATFREVDIRGVFRYCNTYPTALNLVASGQINTKFMVTHKFPLKNALDAFEAASSKESQAVKVIINCSPEERV